MSYSDIRTAVKTRLETISGIANVHDYVIWSDDWDTLLSLFSVDSRIEEWYVGLGGLPSNVITAGDIKRSYSVQIFGLYGMDSTLQASKTFEDKLISIIDSLSTSFNVLELTGVTNEAPIITGAIENTIWSHFPVHRAVISMTVNEITSQELGCNG